jgi:hypothetical protein
MIWLIITACIDNWYGGRDLEKRNKEYKEGITGTLKHIGKDIRVIIVENTASGPTFLNDYSEVFLTHNSRLKLENKGMYETKDIVDTVKHYNIPDEDTVIKITGRYSLLDSWFVNIVRNSEYDAYLKFFNVCTGEFMPNDCIMGLYAIKAKYLKKLNPLSIGATKSMECDFADFIRKECINILEIKKLGLKCIFSDNGLEMIV